MKFATQPFVSLRVTLLSVKVVPLTSVNTTSAPLGALIFSPLGLCHSLFAETGTTVCMFFIDPPFTASPSGSKPIALTVSVTA